MARKLTDEEQYRFGFHDLPVPDKRAAMSVEDLAILLSELDQESPAYILISHELNVRIAREQSVATWKAAGLGFVGALAAAVLGAWSTGAFQSQHNGQRCVCEGNSGELSPKENLSVQLPSSITPDSGGKLVKPPAASAPAIQPASANHPASNPKR